MDFSEPSKYDIVVQYVRQEHKNAKDEERKRKLGYFHFLFCSKKYHGWALYAPDQLPAWVEGELTKITL